LLDGQTVRLFHVLLFVVGILNATAQIPSVDRTIGSTTATQALYAVSHLATRR
jgi:hypothetical protein